MFNRISSFNFRQPAALAMLRNDCIWCPAHPYNGYPPKKKRRAKLQALIERHDHPTILFSAAFDNPLRLLAACEARRMEGIVSKRSDAPYRSGNASDWVKVKCAG